MSKAPNPPALITSGDSLRPPTASRDLIRPVSPSAYKSASSSSPRALPRSSTGSSSISAASPNASQSPEADIALPGPARSNIRNSAIFDSHKDPKRKCPRVGMPIYASAGDITPGTGLFARAPPNAGSVAGSPTSVSAFDAVLTVAFTVLVDNQPYLLTAAPLKPEAWKEWGIRIANKLTMDKSKKKIVNEKGYGLVSLRSTVSQRSGRGRSGSIVKALESTLSLSSLGIAAGLAGIKQIGTVKSCDLGCDGAFHRRRDWCLIELRADFESLKASNTIRIPEDYRQEGGPSELTLKTPQLTYAKSKREVFVVTRNGLRTARTGKPVQDYFCYEGLQELFYTDLEGDGNLYGPRGRDGDAGAPVVDKITGVVYGIVVMANEGKEKSKEREEDKIARLEKEKTVYFVNSYAIMESISSAFPARVVSVATTPEDKEAFETFLREYDSGVFDNLTEGVSGEQEPSKDNTTEQKTAASSS